MSSPIRVLHIVGKMHRAGMESRLMDIYRNIDRNQIQFDFLTHNNEDGDYDDEIRSLGGIVYHIPHPRPWEFFKYIHTLNCFFSDHSYYRIVHSHLNSYSVFALFAAKQAGIPVRINHSRNSGYDRNWQMVFKMVLKLLSNAPTTHKFACSYQAGRFLFGSSGVQPPNQFMVIPNGFDLAKFAYDENRRVTMRKELHLSNDIAIVHVGRMAPQKNHYFLLKIFNSLKKRQPSSKLFLIGDGVLRNKIEKYTESLGLSESVVFLGNLPNVDDYLQAMDAMVFPSLYEGFGTVVLESQCCGLPTIASDCLPHETKVTSCMEFMSLKKNTPEEWAQKTLEMIRSIKRKDRHLEVKAAGYDIKDTYKMLSDFYLNVEV